MEALKHLDEQPYGKVKGPVEPVTAYRAWLWGSLALGALLYMDKYPECEQQLRDVFRVSYQARRPKASLLMGLSMDVAALMNYVHFAGGVDRKFSNPCSREIAEALQAACISASGKLYQKRFNWELDPKLDTALGIELPLATEGTLWEHEEVPVFYVPCNMCIFRNTPAAIMEHYNQVYKLNVDWKCMYKTWPCW